jgi:hypothetical protein
MELSVYVIWNIIVTLILAPIWASIKKNEAELQRQNILVNKTREEVAKDYITRNDHNLEYSRLVDKIDKLDAKIDKLITD